MKDLVYTLNNGYGIAVSEAKKGEALEIYSDWLADRKNRTGKFYIKRKDGELIGQSAKTRTNVRRSDIKSIMWADGGGGYIVYGKYNVDYETGKVTLI